MSEMPNWVGENAYADGTIELTTEEYDALPGLRSTAIKFFLEWGPRLFHERYVTEVNKTPEKDCLNLGSIFHEYAVEGKQRWAVWDGRRAGKKYEAWKEGLDEGVIPITQSTGAVNEDKIMRMFDSMLRNRTARALLESSPDREQAILCKIGGMQCKARLDVISPDGTIIDVKTCTDPRPAKFFKDMQKFKYELSAAFYETVRNMAVADVNVPFYWIAVQNQDPWATYVHELPPECRKHGRNQCAKAVRGIHDCFRHNNWEHAREENSEVLVTPTWYLDLIEHGWKTDV